MESFDIGESLLSPPSQPTLRTLFNPDKSQQEQPPPQRPPKKPSPAQHNNNNKRKKQAPWQKPAQQQSSAKVPKIGQRTVESSVKIKPIKTWYPVFTTNTGIDTLCLSVFRFMKARCPKLLITAEQLQYVTCVAFWNRMVQMGIKIGKLDRYPPDSYELNTLATGIKLPALIQQYISSFGEVELPAGTKIVPRMPSPFDACDYMHYPGKYWRLGHPGQDPPEGPWTLDPDWITSWNENCSKGGRTDFGLDTVDYTDTAGSIHLCVSYLEQSAQVRPVAPMGVTFPEAELGAAFRYRDFRAYNQWPGENAELLFATFEAPPIYPVEVISRVSAQLSKDLWLSKKN